jgi:hypothetical protein
LLIVGTMLAALARRFGAPYPAFLAIAGAALALVPGTPTLKGTGADTTATGATRVAGSINFKDKYAPYFPRVTIHTAYPGRLADADELDRLGLVAGAPEVVAQPLRIPPSMFPPAATESGRPMSVV